MALGISSLHFGESYVVSSDAQRLRDFVFEDDPAVRDAMELRGSIGISTNEGASATQALHPGRSEHLFAQVRVGPQAALMANLFGQFENGAAIRSARFADRLPVCAIPGVAWIVDGQAKQVGGPVTADELLLESIAAIEESGGPPSV